MVKYYRTREPRRTVPSNRNLDATFQALADPTRRALLAALARGQSSVTELARPHRMSLPAVMKHLRVLARAGLISQRKTGRIRRCRLAAQSLKQAEAWISQYRSFWENQFASLDRYLAQQDSKEELPWSKRNLRKKRRSS